MENMKMDYDDLLKNSMFLLSKKDLDDVRKYSNILTASGIGIGAYAGLNIAEMVTTSPSVGLAALVAGAGVLGVTTKKYATKFVSDYMYNKNRKDLDNFVDSF